MSLSFTITSSDDATNAPSDNGLRLDAGSSITVANGTTIAAVLQKNIGGTWVTMPDANNYSTISGDTSIIVDVPGLYRIAVTTATGTWQAEIAGYNSRMYTVSFSGVAVSATQDLFEVVAASGKNLRVNGLFLGQVTDVGDSGEEILPILIKSGQTTSGSSGTSVTPAPSYETDAAAGFTAEANNTGKASGGTIVTHHSEAWNIRSPFIWREKGIEIEPGTRLTVELAASPGGSITCYGTLYVEEFG